MATHKSVKAHSRTKITQNDHGFQTHQEPISNQVASEISRLQRMIVTQTQKRQATQQQLLSKIKHLEITKKSKLPSKPEVSNFVKLLSPAKQAKKIEQDQSIFECRNLLTNIKSERQFEISSFRMKFNEIQKQIRKLNQKVDNELGEFNEKIQQFCSNHKQMEVEATKNMNIFNQQNNNLKRQLNIQLRKIVEQIKHNQLALIEELNRKEEERFCMLQNCVRVCVQTLSRVENQACISFESLDQKMRMARQSIAETKETIEQTFYGSEYKSRDKFESLSSLDCPPQMTTNIPKRPNEISQKICSLERRVESLERRMELIYAQYFSKPFHKILVE